MGGEGEIQESIFPGEEGAKEGTTGKASEASLRASQGFPELKMRARRKQASAEGERPRRQRPKLS